MIFKIVSRADGGALGRYLLSTKNDQVQVLDLRGTVPAQKTPKGLISALKDFDELAKITKGEKTIVHLVINPSDNDRMRDSDWQYAIDKAETALGLAGQPRAVVSHVYQGKEHLHLAYSRVDLERAVCIEMSHSKYKAVQAAREVEMELGLQKTSDRNRGMSKAQKLNQEFLNAQKHQDERAQSSPSDRAAVIAAAWHQSRDGQEFKKQIEAAGYQLAQGNRGVVVMDQNLEPHSIARCVEDIKQKDVREKLKDLTHLPTVDNIRKPAKAVLSHNRARHMIRDELKYQIANDRENQRQQDRDRGPEL